MARLRTWTAIFVAVFAVIPHCVNFFLQTKHRTFIPSKSVVLITGASSGIGRHAALSLVKQGFTVFAGVRKTADSDSLSAEASSNLMKPIILDVTKADQILECVATLTEFTASNDMEVAALVNNAGVNRGNAIESSSLKSVRKMFDVNYFGVAAMTQALLPLLRNTKGRIITVGSAAGLISPPFMGFYAATKHAIEAFCDALRAELSPWGVAVSLLEPGAIQSAIATTYSRSRAEDSAELASSGRSADMVRLGLYSRYLDARERRVQPFIDAAPSAQLTTDAITHALTSPHPQPRYLVGPDARYLVRSLRWLPSTLLDALLAFVSLRTE